MQLPCTKCRRCSKVTQRSNYKKKVCMFLDCEETIVIQNCYAKFSDIVKSWLSTTRDLASESTLSKSVNCDYVLFCLWTFPITFTRLLPSLSKIIQPFRDAIIETMNFTLCFFFIKFSKSSNFQSFRLGYRIGK